MKISLKTWMKFKNRLSRIDDKAADEMERYVNKIGGYENHVDEVIKYAYALTTRYGEAAAAAACEMYDAIASASGVSVPQAEPAPTPEYGEVAKAVNGTAKNTSPKQIPKTVGRLVKRTGADTTLKNAQRDGAQFAWIPSGDTCAFCLTLASRGWQYMSEKALKNGHAEHIHANCDCQYAIRFNSRTEYEGYDPDKYLEMYENAEGRSSQAKINSMRRAMYQDNKDKINAQKRALYRTGRLSPDEYARAVELWKTVDSINVPEYNHIVEEFDNWLTPEEKESCLVSMEVDNYRYFAVTKGHNEYKIYKKEPVTKGIDWLDDVLSEVIGEDWRKYDK